MICLQSAPQGTWILVHAQPNAKHNSVLGEREGTLRIAVTAAPDKGKANMAIAKVLSQAFDLPKSAVKLISGQTSRRKTFLLTGMSVSEVVEALRKIGASD